MNSEITLEAEARPFWVWTGIELVQKNLELYKAPHEYWYQEPGSHRGYDPFYVHEDKKKLIDRVGESLIRERKSLEDQLRDVEDRIKSLNSY